MDKFSSNCTKGYVNITAYKKRYYYCESKVQKFGSIGREIGRARDFTPN
jgi:hypothetical protein